MEPFKSFVQIVYEADSLAALQYILNLVVS